ncbi:permease-like cell division protein FtsX [Streptococcus cuniculipharyngis]|uniref:Cell division protein FtsX n=1 Tax=Streptococcus cuniculipharyngis TaxID=1562651 RepID=A0A5C5SFY0_9STRE|nr:permease-like cell division protein FtsX [Streptococcus cuniculipharyngis]TWS99048.1 ABC transporter permease [Streptococcus cuniculipharyngis]
MIKSLWESLKSLKRNGWASFIAISSVAFTLGLVGCFVTVLLNTERLATGIQNNVKINAYLAADSTETQETMTNAEGQVTPNPNYHQVYNQLVALPDVKSVTFSSKQEQLDQLKATLGEAWDTVEGDSLSDVYIVEVTSSDKLKGVAAQIEGMAGIEEFNYGGIETEKLMKVTNLIRLWGLVGAGLLVLVAVFLISNTVRMTIMARRRDIEIMRLVGAKNSYIRGPFFFEGAWIGLLGTILPAILIFFLYQFAYGYFRTALESSGLSMYPPGLFVPAIIGGMALLGILIGSFGSLFAMRRYLKF